MPLADPISAAWNTVARFDDYESAQRATAGALTGLWAGLLFGILLGLFTSGHSFIAVAATGAALGVLWGAAFGAVAHARTKGQRDFSSVRQLVAAHYDLIARGGTVDRARSMLGDAGLLPQTGLSETGAVR